MVDQLCEEWCGGRVVLPQYFFDDDGVPFRPEVAVWTSSKGIVGVLAMGAHGADSDVVEALRESMKDPEIGRPRQPRVVRVADGQVAALLRSNFPNLSVKVRRTPELKRKALLRELYERVRQRATSVPHSYLVWGVAPETVAGFMRAAARFCDSMMVGHLWQVQLEVPSLGLPNGEALYLRAAIPGRRKLGFPGVMISSNPGQPIHDFKLVVTFAPGDTIPPEVRKEVLANGWAVAGPDCYPFVRVIDRDGVDRAWTEREARLLWACLEGLTRLNWEARDRGDVLSPEECRLAWSLRVRIQQLPGRPTVRLNVSEHPRPEREDRPPDARQVADERDDARVRGFVKGCKRGRHAIAMLLRQLSFWRNYRNIAQDEDHPPQDIWTAELVEEWMFSEYLPKAVQPTAFLVRIPRVLGQFFRWLSDQGVIEATNAAAIRAHIRKRARTFCTRARDPKLWNYHRRYYEAARAGAGHHKARQIAAGIEPPTGVRLVATRRRSRKQSSRSSTSSS